MRRFLSPHLYRLLEVIELQHLYLLIDDPLFLCLLSSHGKLLSTHPFSEYLPPWFDLSLLVEFWKYLVLIVPYEFDDFLVFWLWCFIEHRSNGAHRDGVWSQDWNREVIFLGTTSSQAEVDVKALHREGKFGNHTSRAPFLLKG